MKTNNCVKFLLFALVCLLNEVNSMVDHCGIEEYVYSKTNRTDAFYIPKLCIAASTKISGNRPLVLDYVLRTDIGNTQSMEIENPVFFKKYDVSYNWNGNDVYELTHLIASKLNIFDEKINININKANVLYEAQNDEYKKIFGQNEEYLIDKDFGAGSIEVLKTVKNKTLNLNENMVIPITVSTSIDAKFIGLGNLIYYVSEGCELKINHELPVDGITFECFLQNNAKVYPLNVNDCVINKDMAFHSRVDINSVEKKSCKGYVCFNPGATISGKQIFDNNHVVFEGATTINSALLSFGTTK